MTEFSTKQYHLQKLWVDLVSVFFQVYTPQLPPEWSNFMLSFTNAIIVFAH